MGSEMCIRDRREIIQYLATCSRFDQHLWTWISMTSVAKDEYNVFLYLIHGTCDTFRAANDVKVNLMKLTENFASTN